MATVPPPEASVPIVAHDARSGAAPETARWLRRWVAVAVGLLTLVTVLTAFAEDMPASHRLAVPPAAAVMLAAWMVELSGVRWPRFGLIAANVLPNLWLAYIHHGFANYLFLLLLVAWVALVGSRAEGAAAFLLSLATVGVAAGSDADGGQLPWSAWISLSAILLLVWLMALVLRRQERLVAELRRSRAEAERRSHELGTLLDVSRSVASTLEMQPLLDAVLDALGSVVRSTGTAILTVDEARSRLTFAHWRGPASFTAEIARAVRYRIQDFGPVWERLCRDEPVVIADVRGETGEAAIFRRLVGESELDTAYGFIRSAMWVPLVVRGRMVGLLSITDPAPDAYGPRDASLALAIARQAAVAMENARLHERARQAAVLEERQRLARELHDSVTQALYGVSLYAEAAGRALADGESDAVTTNLREIRETTQEALGEMRLLLFDLRPPLLEEHGLARALRTRLGAVEARAGLVAELSGEGAERLPPETEQELYRLAQEALNNVVKHAHARRVAVRLDVSTDRAVLEVADDGIGFEPALRGGDGFGLPGMRERAERLGGRLQVESAPGAGTRVRAEVPR
jgi:signal transduction histidine kinase